MCKKCKECFYFVPKSKKPPFGAFDYIAGNETGICINYYDQPVEWVGEEDCEFTQNKDS
jgi:hypothetical protein